MDFPTWNLNDLAARELLEEMVGRLGGAALSGQLDAQAAARGALQATLAPSQRDLYLLYADAVSDAWSAREEATTRLALSFGVGIGAALACFPEDPPDQVARTAAQALAAALGSELVAADAVARAALAALRWAPAGAELR